jgi:hypothetical protein
MARNMRLLGVGACACACIGTPCNEWTCICHTCVARTHYARRPLRGHVGSILFLVFTLLGLTRMNECPVTLCFLILLDVAKEVPGPAEGSVSDRERPSPFVRLDS